ncbi:hypothetical protein BH24ACT5_BH24ACT5_09230 [soil metagenome]
MDLTDWGHPTRSTQLSVESVIITLTHTVCGILHAQGYRRLFAGHMRNDNADWHVAISSRVQVEGVSVPRNGLSFPGVELDRATPGQVAISAGNHGFSGSRLWNLDINTDPSELVMIVLSAFLEKSGYSGLDACLTDRQIRQSSTTQSLGRKVN